MNPRSITFLALILLAVQVFAADPATAPSTQPALPALSGKLGAPIALFNGKDLAGWSWHTTPRNGTEPKLEDLWTVKEGVLHLATNRSPGYLRGDKDFSNFVLVVEQRHITRGNGGILFGITGPDVVWPRTVQVQGQVGDIGDLINQGKFKMITDPARTTVRAADTRIAKIGPPSEKPVGEWSTIELTVDHSNVWVKVNGQLQNIATGVEPLPGKVGLQSEGPEMEFRKIELTPIEEK